MDKEIIKKCILELMNISDKAQKDISVRIKFVIKILETLIIKAN